MVMTHFLLPSVVSHFIPSALCVHTVVGCWMVCHLRLLDISACPFMQNSDSPQDLPAGLDSTVTCAYVLVLACRRSDSPFLMKISRKCDDQSRQRHKQILWACCIRSCVHLVRVNLLCMHILVSLPIVIFWAFVADDTNTHCAAHTLTVCLYCGSNLGPYFLWPQPEAIWRNL